MHGRSDKGPKGRADGRDGRIDHVEQRQALKRQAVVVDMALYEL